MTSSAGRPTLVLLHGGGLGPWSWSRHVAALSDAYACLTPTLPGHRGHGSGTFDFATAYDEVVQLLEPHGGDALVAGLSLGGQLAVSIAASRPDLVRGAVVSGVNLVGLPGLNLLLPTLPLMAPLKSIGALQRASARSSAIPPEEVADFCSDGSAMDSRALASVFRESGSFRLPPSARLDDVLALVGTKEPKVIRRSASQLTAAGATVRQVEGGKHTWPLADPALFAGAVRAWDRRSALPPALAAVP